MNHCPECGHQRQGEEKKCPECDIFYSKIDEFLAEEKARDEQDAFRTRVKRILAAADRKDAFRQELKSIYQAMPRGSVFVLYVIVAFIFAMLVVVI